MHELLRLARALRREHADPRQVFAHRVAIGIAVAALILMLSLFR